MLWRLAFTSVSVIHSKWPAVIVIIPVRALYVEDRHSGVSVRAGVGIGPFSLRISGCFYHTLCFVVNTDWLVAACLCLFVCVTVLPVFWQEQAWRKDFGACRCVWSSEAAWEIWNRTGKAFWWSSSRARSLTWRPLVAGFRALNS